MPFYLVHSGIVTIDNDSLNLKIYQKQRIFGTRWRRDKVLCVYSKHNNGKARSREDHGASPSLWKEYCLKTRQTIQVGSGKLNTVHSKWFNDHTLRSDIFLPKCTTHSREMSDKFESQHSLSPTICSDVRVDISRFCLHFSRWPLHNESIARCKHHMKEKLVYCCTYLENV